MRRKALITTALHGDIMASDIVTNRHARCLCDDGEDDNEVMSQLKPLIISNMRKDVTL